MAERIYSKASTKDFRDHWSETFGHKDPKSVAESHETVVENPSLVCHCCTVRCGQPHQRSVTCTCPDWCPNTGNEKSFRQNQGYAESWRSSLPGHITVEGTMTGFTLTFKASSREQLMRCLADLGVIY